MCPTHRGSIDRPIERRANAWAAVADRRRACTCPPKRVPIDESGGVTHRHGAKTKRRGGGGARSRSAAGGCAAAGDGRWVGPGESAQGEGEGGGVAEGGRHPLPSPPLSSSSSSPAAGGRGRGGGGGLRRRGASATRRATAAATAPRGRLAAVLCTARAPAARMRVSWPAHTLGRVPADTHAGRPAGAAFAAARPRAGACRGDPRWSSEVHRCACAHPWCYDPRVFLAHSCGGARGGAAGAADRGVRAQARPGAASGWGRAGVAPRRGPHSVGVGGRAPLRARPRARARLGGAARRAVSRRARRP